MAGTHANRAARMAAAVLVALVVVAGLAVVVPGLTSKAASQTPATPTCPTGSTFNPATGQCEETPACSPGSTFVAGQCQTTTSCPAGTTGIASLAIPTATCLPSLAVVTCSPGQSFVRFLGSPDFGVVCQSPPPCAVGFAATPSGVCAAPANFTCPPGEALSGTSCLPPPACPAGESVANLPTGGTTCVAPTPGFSFAIGGGPGFAGPNEPEAEPEPEIFCPGQQLPALDSAGNPIVDDDGFAVCREPDQGSPAPAEDDEELFDQVLMS
jgi:hypothetical protein